MLGALTRTIDSRPVAFVRIVVGIASVLLLVETRTTLQSVAAGRLAVPSFAWSPRITDPLVDIYSVVGLACAVALIAGVLPVVACLGVAATQATAMLTDQQTYSNHLVLLIAICTFLALANPGGAWTLTRGIASSRSPYWPLFLIQTQISTMYFWTAISKINPTFLDGLMLQISMRPQFALVVGDLQLKVMAIVTIVTELFLAAGLWFARLRPFAFVIGFGLHTSIALTLLNPYPLIPFGLMTLSAYLFFLRLPEPNGRIVVWDSSCGFCHRWIAVCRALDWFGIHRFIGSHDTSALETTSITPQPSVTSLELEDSQTGERASGFDAFRRILEVCPLTFLIAPILGFPPIRALGVRLYGHTVADRTFKDPAVDTTNQPVERA